MYRDPDRRLAVTLLVLGVIAALIQTHSAGSFRAVDLWPLLLCGLGVVIMPKRI